MKGIKMNETITTDLSKFGYRELAMAGELLNWFNDHSYPEDFNSDDVKLYMNANSGNVFLSNEDGQVLMMNGDKLETFYSCPICGHEGFLEDMKHTKEDNASYTSECDEYLKEIGA